MSFLLYFIGQNYWAKFTTYLFYYQQFPSRVYNEPIYLPKMSWPSVQQNR